VLANCAILSYKLRQTVNIYNIHALPSTCRNQIFLFTIRKWSDGQSKLIVHLEISQAYKSKLVQHLYKLITYTHNQLLHMIQRHASKLSPESAIHVSQDCPKSPIFSLETQHPRSLAKHCQDVGYIVRPVVPPTVPTRRVRVCLHAGNTYDEVDGMIRRIDLWLSSRNKSSGRSISDLTVKAQI